MSKTKIRFLCLAALLVVLIAGTVYAASSGFSVDWWVFSGGGAPSSAGDFSMNGSIGQSIVGTSSSTDYSIDHGYWQRGTYDIYLPLVMK